MTHKVVNRAVAAFVFLVTMTVYAITLAPTVVFWDVGEFIAAAHMLQVPHPPGAPLFLLLTRIAMMFPFAADLAVRAHAFSALCSALAIMFTYLVTVRVLMDFRGMPKTILEMVTVYGSAAVGAFALALSTTFWDNSIEAEVYGASMLFLTVIMWLVMRWYERSEAEGNEKYILLIGYLIGLSLGVHLLALLAIFPVLMIVYFRRYEVNFNSFMKFGMIAVGIFAVVYPGIVKYLPGMMDGDFKGEKSDLIRWIPWILIAVSFWGVYYTYKHRQKIAHVALLSIVLIFIGYTTYTTVLIRSNANPPMNENYPNNLERLTSYLGREQYGDAPLFMPRRYSQEPHHQGIYTNYSSDMDFLWRYQLSHMFFRYLGWNFIGQAGDVQDSGVGVKDTWGIPFMIGLLGLYYQFKKDWKMGAVFAAAFIILGPVLALYQNQQEPQPRERDYFYVGAFYVFAIWIAHGVIALVDYTRQAITSTSMESKSAYAVVGIAVLAIPFNLARVNWESHDHSGNYVAWDYSYNILQTCEPNAILFTNGDNDTFPLWYLQDVEGIRRDVRIVNLSLINTPWYIQQMKNEPYYKEAKAVPISVSDAQIARIQPTAWETRDMLLPVTPEAIERYKVTDSSVVQNGHISFKMSHTLQYGRVTAIRIQDRLVQDIIFTNKWKYPIYFAVTVSPDSKIGLDEYLWFHGLAWRLEPRKVKEADAALDPDILATNIMKDIEGFSRTARYGYRFRGLADPDVYFNENDSRLMINYRSAFIRLALYYANTARKSDESVAVLERMESLIPRSKVPMGWELTSDIASFYQRLGRMDKFEELAKELEPVCSALIEAGNVNFQSYYNPYRVLLEIYRARNDYPKSLALLQRLEKQFPEDPTLKQEIAMLQSMMQASQDSGTTGGQVQ